MRINNNIMALNANRQLAVNNNNVASSTEKLSSGFRINRAGDDAAGLAISEKMRAQIRGLEMASKNSQDAISLVQTAEGALQEVHSMLQRMSELATQSATGTNEEVDREAISAEFEALKQEINDISTQTNFNNMKLLDGSFGKSKLAVDAASTLKVGSSISIATTPAAVYSVFGNTGMTAGNVGTFTIDFGAYDPSTGFDDGVAVAAATHLQVSFVDSLTGNTTNTVIAIDDALQGDIANGTSFTLNLGAAGLGTYSISAAQVPGETFPATPALAKQDFLSALDGKTVVTAASGTFTDGSVKIQVGAGAEDQLSIAIGKMDSASLGLTDASISLQADAGRAITLTRAAINTVSSQRASLGAMQNRLQHKINNLDTSAENLQAAESRIRDLDMAKEMTAFTKNNILVQASTAMLAQANAAPQAVLQLLQ